jgi:mRNA interferase MazF
MQENWLLATDIATVVVVPLTSNVALESLSRQCTCSGRIVRARKGLRRRGVSRGPVSREFVEPYAVGQVPSYVRSKIVDGIRLVLGI